MARMADSKKIPEQIAEERIEAARKSKAIELDLSLLGLTKLPASIGQLAALRRLRLYRNKLTALPEVIAKLINLQHLDISHNRLEALPECIGELTQLVRFNLRVNLLTSLPKALGRLTHLQSLNVIGNGLMKLPQEVGDMVELRVLVCSYNRLATLPESIRKLTKLERLYLNNNRLAALPETLCQATKLKEIYLHFNPRLRLPPKVLGPTWQDVEFKQLKPRTPAAILSDYFRMWAPPEQTPEEIAEERIEAARKSKATELDLHNLGLTEVPASVGKLAQLTLLKVNNNRLVALPETIGKLTNLQFLSTQHNQLSALPEAIGKLKELLILWASNNQLTTLPRGLRNLPNLGALFLHNNPRLGLPAEILGPTWKFGVDAANPASILDYYFKMRGGRRPLNEVRLLLVGRGAAGKTSVVRRLTENKFSPREKETKGIDIRPWELRCGRDSVRAHVWDFAGQVITHATHQFFLSHRSVYVLVLTGREDSEKLDAEYWLRLIQAFGTEPATGQTSPVIMALNKWELTECKLDRNALQEKYPFIVGFVETDCRSGLGVADLKKKIRETVDGMASVREAFPQAWFAIKEHLATMKADYVSFGEFRAQCLQLGESDAGAQDSLARVLHRLGVALNYAEDERLREATVLNPHWVTNGIYTLLRDATCEKGIMTLADVARVLPQEKPEMRRYLVELMRRFDLAFPLTEMGDEWLVPQRLPPTQPKLRREWQEPGLTRLRYTYTALPEGLIPRFITRTYPLSEGQERWANGVVLVMDDARALVRADPSERCVTAAVSGSADGRRRLAGLVREDLRRIHADIRGLDPLEEMELGGKPGEWVRVQTLEADERKKQPSAAATSKGTVVVNNTNELNRVSAPAARDPSQRKVKVFISYSSRDARQHDELTVRLKPLRSEGLVETWSDRCLVAGEEWDKSIRRELEEADVIMLLWSAQFEASDYIQSVEVKRAMERAKAGEAVVVSIILEKCGWRKLAGDYQALPPKGKPVRNTQPQRNAWYAVQEGLRKVLEKLRAKSKQ